MSIQRKVITKLTISQSDLEYLQAKNFQQQHGLSTSDEAIRSRIRRWRKQQERNDQEGATGVEGIEIR